MKRADEKKSAVIHHFLNLAAATSAVKLHLYTKKLDQPDHRTQCPDIILTHILPRECDASSDPETSIMFRAAFVASLLFAFTNLASAESDKFSILGYGTQSCGSWLAQRQPTGNAYSLLAMQGYTLGYITAFNRYNEYHDTDATEATDADGIYYSIDKYCRDNPTSRLYEAADWITKEMVRAKLQPAR